MPEDPSTEIAVRPTQGSAIMPIDPQEMKNAQTQHQALVRALLDESDWQGKPDAKGSFVKKSGWRKIAAGYSISFARVEETVERDDDGKPLRATYTAAAIAPNGRRVEATGHCAFAESRFSGANGNVSKLENDMRATAECVPLRAEMLTRSGFKRHGDLTIGEEVLAYDTATDRCEWVELLDVRAFADAEVVRVRNASLDITCTPDHTWAVRVSRGAAREAGRRLVKTRDLKAAHNQGRRHHIDHARIAELAAAGMKSPAIAAAVGTTPPTVRRSLARGYAPMAAGNHSRGQIVLAAKAPGGDHPMSPRDAAIIGWLLTDGSIGTRGGYVRAHIDQAKAPYVEELRSLLGTDVTSEHVTIPDPTHLAPNGQPWGKLPCTRFSLSARAARRLGIKCRSDILPLIGRLSAEARAAMLDAMLKADGSRIGEAGSWVWGKTDPVSVAAFQALATLEGCALGIPQRKVECPALHVQTLRVHRHAHVPSLLVEPAGREDVWCPTTPLGTWVMRLDGQVAITGNTRAKNRAVSDIIGMGKVSAEEVNAGYPDAGPTFGPEAAGKLYDRTRDAVAYMLTSPDGALIVEAGDETVDGFLDALVAQFGYLPGVVCMGIGLLSKRARDLWGDAEPEEPVASEAVPAEPEVIEGTASETEAAVAAEAAPAVEELPEAEPVGEVVADAPLPAEIGTQAAGDEVQW